MVSYNMPVYFTYYAGIMLEDMAMKFLQTLSFYQKWTVFSNWCKIDGMVNDNSSRNDF